MSAARNDGGPAFPADFYRTNSGEAVPFECSGMSLRDHFAGLALQGMLANPEELTLEGEDEASVYTWADHAKAAYQLADAMLKARQA